LKVVKLTEKNIPAFRDYFKKFAREQDESYPPLADFTVNENEPVYLLVEGNEIRGAAALMGYPEYREVRQARMRIFHSVNKDYISYNKLLNSILLHTEGFNSIYGFIEDNYSNIAMIWEDLGFEARRFAWILERNTVNYTKPQFPEGYELKTFRDGLDEDNWCAIINEAFEHSLGHVRMTPGKIEQWKIDPSYINGGMKLLWHYDKPVGTVALIKETHNNEEVIFIESIGVLNAYQGKGLGKNILRAGIDFAVNYGSKKVMLSVNGENEKAAELYFKEGFKKEALYKCYYYDMNKKDEI
jgi:mycothiol synthase